MQAEKENGSWCGNPSSILGLDTMLTTVLSEWVHAAGSWYNSTLMSCEGKVAVEFVGWT